MSQIHGPTSSKSRQRKYTVLAIAYGLPFVWVGLQHFIRPEIFEPLVPEYLGWPWFWVHITGWTEIGLGLGIMSVRTRRVACRLMVLQLALLYLANLNMWVNDIAFEGHQLGTVGHVARLGAQLVLIALAEALARTVPSPRGDTAAMR